MNTQLLKNKLSSLLSKMSIKDWIIIVLLIILIILGCSSSYYYRKTLYPQIVYANDSIEYYQNKAKEEYAMRLTYVQTVEQLKKSNSELKNEVKNLKEHPVLITKTKIEFVHDTVKAISDSITLGIDSCHRLHWSYNDSTYYSLNGVTDVEPNYESFTTTINDMHVNTSMTLDLIDDGDNFKVIAKSDNPYVYIRDINSVVIDPETSPTLKKYTKPKRWGIGPYVGVGVNFGTSFTGQAQVGVGGSIGISIHYSLLQW